MFRIKVDLRFFIYFLFFNDLECLFLWKGLKSSAFNMSWYEDIVSNTDHSSLPNYDGVYNTLADKL